MSEPLPALDPLLHQPARTQLVAFLASRGEATFSELKRVLGVTDGNLGAHLAKLVEAGYVRAREDASGPRAQSVFLLTAKGRKALALYVERLAALMNLQAGPEAPAATALKPRTT